MIYQRVSGARGGRIPSGIGSAQSGRVGVFSSANKWDPRYSRQSLVALYLPGQGQTNVTGACSQWNDASGNGNHLLQGTGAFRPVINADGSLTFDGISQYMQAAFTLVQPSVVSILFTPVTWTLADSIFDGFTSLGGSLVQFNTATPNVEAYAGSFSADYTGPTNGTRAVVQVAFNGAGSSIQMNNGTLATGNYGASNMNGFTLASPGTPGTQFGNITAFGVSIRNANDPILNAKDRGFWMKLGGL